MFDTSWIDAATAMLQSRADVAPLGLALAEGFAMTLWAGTVVAVSHLCRHAQPARRPYGC
jgi:hypothetical protein